MAVKQKKFHLSALFTLIFSLTGCIPLRQEERISGPVHPTVLISKDQHLYLLVEIDLNREKLVAEQSYLVAPSRKRYGVQVESHKYDKEQKFHATRADVYPVDADGSRLRRWQKGVWSFHFVIESNGISQVVDQKWRYWTFYYNPIIHGPPN